MNDNETLRTELQTANDKIKVLEGENSSYAEENDQKTLGVQAYEILVHSEMQFNTGNYSASRDILKDADPNLLTENGQTLYNWLKGKLEARGFK